MTKPYPQECIERASEATVAAIKEIKRQLALKKSEITCVGYPYVILNGEELLSTVAHARQDVPELCRRLKLAIEALKATASCDPNSGILSNQMLINALEAPMEGEK